MSRGCARRVQTRWQEARNWRPRRALRSGRRGEIATCGASWDPIAATDDGFDNLGLTELLAEAGNGYGHGIGERINVLIPDALEQLLCTHDHTIGGEQD